MKKRMTIVFKNPFFLFSFSLALIVYFVIDKIADNHLLSSITFLSVLFFRDFLGYFFFEEYFDSGCFTERRLNFLISLIVDILLFLVLVFT